MDAPAAAVKKRAATKESEKQKAATRESTPTEAPPPAGIPASREIFVKERAELHLFDFDAGSFVVATVSETGTW